jgi:uncharacterized protein
MPASDPSAWPVAPALVLDTNAVLDWLLFAHPAMAPWAAAIQQRRLRWLVCPRLRAELAATLRKPSLQRWNPDSEHILTVLDSWAILSPQPVVPPAEALRCTDPDDQVFIDMALATRARWLVTRDRALLKLARRAAARGLTIVPPEHAAEPGAL